MAVALGEGVSLQFGKYRVLAELGHGGMADVYLAMVDGPAGFTKLAVVKRLRANLAEDPEFVAMLVDEARITARLNHPNVVQTIEVGQVGEEYYLAMEYLDGQPLHRLQRRAERTGTAVDKSLSYLVVYDALAGLHHAHELVDYDGTSLGVVHRDVTPQNIIITYDGQVKVVDFGVAKAAGRACVTQQGIVKGKVRYMAPEQAAGQELDRRSDLFAAGILLWEAATGRKFWAGEDDNAIVARLIAGDFEPSPRAIDASVSEEVDRICRKALSIDPAARYATAQDFAADMEEALSTELHQARSQLSPLLMKLFAKERRQIRAVIERAGRESIQSPVSLAPLSSRSSLSPSVMVDSLAPLAGGPRLPSVWPGPAPTETGSASRSELGIMAAFPMRRRAGRRLVALLSLAATLALAGLLSFSTSRGQATHEPNSVARHTAQPDVLRLQFPKRGRAASLATVHGGAAVQPTRAKHAPPPPPPESGSSLILPPPPAEPTPAVVIPRAARPMRQPSGEGRRKLTLDTADPWVQR